MCYLLIIRSDYDYDYMKQLYKESYINISLFLHDQYIFNPPLELEMATNINLTNSYPGYVSSYNDEVSYALGYWHQEYY